MTKRPGNNAQTHVAQVLGSLLAIQQGQAKTKTEAAQLTGTTPRSLTPQHLAALVASSPRLRHMLATNPLDISADVTKDDGSKARVSMREALATGAQQCVATLAVLSPKIGKLTKEERDSMQQCERWLRLCRDIGLFADVNGVQLPGELANQQPEDTGSLEWYLEDARGHGLPSGLLTVIPAHSEIVPDAEGVTDVHNV